EFRRVLFRSRARAVRPHARLHARGVARRRRVAHRAPRSDDARLCRGHRPRGPRGPRAALGRDREHRGPRRGPRRRAALTRPTTAPRGGARIARSPEAWSSGGEEGPRPWPGPLLTRASVGAQRTRTVSFLDFLALR